MTAQCEISTGRYDRYVLIDIIRSGAVRWITGQAIRDAFPLINANVVNVHFTWKLHVHKVLRLERSYDEAQLVTNKKDVSVGSTHERDQGSG